MFLLFVISCDSRAWSQVWPGCHLFLHVKHVEVLQDKQVSFLAFVEEASIILAQVGFAHQRIKGFVSSACFALNL
jgi:hypothetical protein